MFVYLINGKLIVYIAFDSLMRHGGVHLNEENCDSCSVVSDKLHPCEC